MVGSLPGINKCAKFQVEIFTGGRIYRILQGGGSNFPFSIDFCMGITTVQVQRYLTALPVISEAAIITEI